MKVKNGHFDWGDLVNDLHLRFTCERYRGDQMDFVYIDEVQDLTMRQIYLFKYICKNVDEGFVFSGDTAQTIARGVDFRFQDIRSLFYEEFFPSSSADGVKKKRRLSQIFHLSQNFRTHAGVLKLAQSVIDLIFRFFPKSIDILRPETSMIYGEKPILLKSGQNENAIITIFGHSCNASRQITGFGAEQVILVRDDKVRQEISGYVGKQALVLTIVECKGLEFQDVLLYNFFASSPLKNQWRVIYEYMNEQNLLGTGSHVAFPSFNESKHSLMCSELKQLYVAITRTRQRLWIYENIEDFSKPMFDYWEKKCFVQVRVLDESLAQAMRVASTPEEWKSQGFKLLTENHYEMATMCFERAGDEYWKKISKAEGLRADADLKRISDPDKARSNLKEAAEMFGAIGKADRAAECFFDLEDFEKAGKLYLESCEESKLELAGKCFYRAGCYDLAAEVYAKGKNFARCLKVCTNAKLFDIGLQYIQYWNQLVDKDDSVKRSRDIEKMEHKFLEDCASHYHGLKDIQAMMKFVKAFQSTELMRTFLRSRSCIDELLLLERELGNFLEAAEIAKQRGNPLLEADLLGKAGKYKEAILSSEAVNVNPTELAGSQAVTTAAKPKYRHQHHQRPEEVVVSIFAKRVPPSSVKVDFGEQILSVRIDIPGEEAYHFQPRLFGKIVPAKCKYEVLSTKVEIRLAKAVPIQWASLEYSKEVIATQKINAFTVEQVASTPEEWKSRGLKLLTENNYEMATMCFERAGDEYLEKFSKAEGLRADADLKRISDPGKARSILKEAAEMFGTIGKADRAAECFFDLEDFEKAGKLYLESCGESKLELAGECFYRAGCYDLAAEVYAKGKFFAQCLKVCTNAKLFDMGLQYIQYWNQLVDKDYSVKRSMDFEKMEHEFLKDCANHYHGRKEIQAMMKFVKAFQSTELMRTFLRSRSCIDELLSLERELGNFLEAAEIAKQRGKLLLEADLLWKAGKYKEASAQILWCMLARSFSSSESTGWPLKHFRQKEELLTKVERLAKNDSHSFWVAIATEVGVLSDKRCSLLEIHQSFEASVQHGSFRVEILSARKILDALLQFDISKFVWEDKLVADLAKHSKDKILKHQTSTETLVYFWNFWKDKVLNIFQCLKNLESKKENDDYKDCEEFCLNVMGVWRRFADKNTDYILISPDMHWLKGVDQNCLKKIDDLVSIDFQSLISAARSYWSMELLFVGKSLLGVFELLYKHSIRESMSLFCSSMLLIHIFEAAQFLFGCQFLQDRSSDINMLHKYHYLQLASDDLITYTFPLDWRRSVAENMVTLRETERCQNVLEKIIVMKLACGPTSHGLIGRIVTILIGSAGFTDNLYAKVIEKFDENPAWQVFVDMLRRLPRARDRHSGGMHVLHYFKTALADTYNVNWVMEQEYMSPDCFVYLMERLVILTSCAAGICFTTRSSFVEWFISKEQMLRPAASPKLYMRTLEYVKYQIEQILVDESNMTLWIIRSKLSAKEYYPLLVLRLVVLLCVICLNTVKHYDALSRLLGQGHIAAVLPRGFMDVLRKCKRSAFLGKGNVNLIAEAFALIENPLVIVSAGADCSMFKGQNFILVEADDSRDVTFRKLFLARVAQVAGTEAAAEEQEGKCCIS